MHQIELPALEAIVRLDRCETPPPDPVVTTAAPVREHPSLYITARDCLYAVNAGDGTARWCQQVTLIRTRNHPPPPPGISMPPPPRMSFGTPRLVDGAVYVSAYGFGEYTCVFTASDGELRWWTPTDARIASMPFQDFALPLVKNGIVYSGTYALNEQDGHVLWRTPIDTSEEGSLALHTLAGETLVASTQWGIYAINAQYGQIRWRYLPEEGSLVSGPPVVAGRMLFAGTSDSVGYPENSHVFALDVETGAEIWRFPMGSYIGAAVDHERIYVHSRDRSLSAFENESGVLRWQHRFITCGGYPPTIAQNVLYVTIDGAYALSCEDGAVLWHQALGSGRGGSFRQPVVLDDTVYLVRLDQRGRGMLYALDARTGAECWHTPYPSALAFAQ